MFGFFSRKSKRTPEKPASNSEKQLKFDPPLRVVAPRSNVEEAGEEPFFLVFAVMQFVTAMVSKGLYRYPEIDPKAMQVLHADAYSSEVKNGGHSQFIHNAGQEIGAMIANARAGLIACGAKGQLATLEKMSGWIVDHPDEASEQTGFEDGRDDFLDTLDHAFYDADEAAPMENLLARWIASWPDLQIVDNDDYEDAIRRLMIANPQREGRLLHKSVGKLAGQMILSRRDVGAGLACAKIAPPEVKMAFGMARMLNVEGEKQMVFQLQTSAKKTRLCSAIETHVTVYDYIAPEESPVSLPGENPLGANAPSVGARLGRAEEPEITTVIELAEQYHAPAAVDLLLRKAGFDPADAIVSANSVVQKEEGAIVNWVVLASGQVFLFQSSPNGGVLLRGKDDKSVAEAAMAELVEHFDRSAAAG
ncbi:DMP19 family protein [Mesorhizobium sp. PL10]